MKKMRGDLQFTSIFLPLLITVCSWLPIFTLTGSLSVGGFSWGRGAPAAGRGVGGQDGVPVPWLASVHLHLCPAPGGDTATPCSWAPTAAHIAQHRGAQRRQQGNPLPVLHLHGLAGMGQLVPLPTGACPSAVVLRGYAVPLSF